MPGVAKKFIGYSGGQGGFYVHVDFHNKLITDLSTQQVDTKGRGNTARKKIGRRRGGRKRGVRTSETVLTHIFPETRSLKKKVSMFIKGGQTS